MKIRLAALPVLAAVLAAASAPPAAHALTSGNATVTLSANATAMIQIVDAAVTLAPTPTDYDNDFVEAAGASGLRVRVKGNSTTGLVLRVRCPDAVPEIALADLFVKTATAPGTGGSSLAVYTPVSAVDQDLWSTGASQHVWATVTTDIRIQNLINYDDAAGGGTTDYTNTLTYTVAAQ